MALLIRSDRKHRHTRHEQRHGRANGAQGRVAIVAPVYATQDSGGAPLSPRPPNSVAVARVSSLPLQRHLSSSHTHGAIASCLSLPHTTAAHLVCGSSHRARHPRPSAASPAAKAHQPTSTTTTTIRHPSPPSTTARHHRAGGGPSSRRTASQRVAKGRQLGLERRDLCLPLAQERLESFDVLAELAAFDRPRLGGGLRLRQHPSVHLQLLDA